MNLIPASTLSPHVSMQGNCAPRSRKSYTTLVHKHLPWTTAVIENKTSPDGFQDLFSINLYSVLGRSFPSAWCIVRTAPPRSFPLSSLLGYVLSKKKILGHVVSHAKVIMGGGGCFKRHYCFQSSFTYFSLVYSHLFL